MMHEKITVIVADDHAAVRSGLVMILESDPQIQVVGQAADGQQALRLCEDLSPQVALLDIRMPGRDGVWAAGQIASRTRTRPLMLTTYDDAALVQQALNVGAAGYLLKTVTGPELITGVQHVAAGRHVVDPAVTGTLIAALRTPQGLNATTSTEEVGGESASDSTKLLELLTARELDVVRLVSEGKTNQQIARQLVVSVATVKTHISAIYQKTGLESRVQLGFLGRSAT